MATPSHLLCKQMVTHKRIQDPCVNYHIIPWTYMKHTDLGRLWPIPGDLTLLKYIKRLIILNEHKQHKHYKKHTPLPFALAAAYSFKMVVKFFPHRDCNNNYRLWKKSAIIKTRLECIALQDVNNLLHHFKIIQLPTYKYTSRNSSIFCAVLSILLQMRAFVYEYLTCRWQAFPLQVA